MNFSKNADFSKVTYSDVNIREISLLNIEHTNAKIKININPFFKIDLQLLLKTSLSLLPIE